MIQGGDPEGTGRGGPGYKFADEFHPDAAPHQGRPALDGQCRTNTNGSQFFVTVAATPWLDNKHSIFGEVTEGYDVVKKISKLPRNSQDRPLQGSADQLGDHRAHVGARARAMRLAIFGGTFDPIHNAHLAVAREAADRFHLDRVLFIPAAHPPHKQHGARAPYEDRVRMAELATAGDPRFRVSRLEEGTGRSYSIDTIEKVRAEMAPRR